MLLPGPLIETWALYSAGSLIILLRIICRWRMIGVRYFQVDDYLIVVAWLTYTAMTLAAHIVGSHGDIHSLTLSERAALASLPPETTDSLIIGTKWFCVGVATYITFIWLLKLNMLFLYQRIVHGLWVEKFIVPTMGLVAITYFSTLMILFLPCRPYERMWIPFPDQGEYCKPQSFLNMVPPLVMNIVTDLCIMAIPAPVILPVRTTIWRKLGLLFLFFAGFFIMTAAVLRVFFVLVARNGATAAIWSCREDVVAIVVGQAIFIRPIFTRCFWNRNFPCPNAAAANKPRPTPGTRLETEVVPLAPTRMSNLKGVLKGKKDPFSLSAALESNGSREEGDELRHDKDAMDMESLSSSSSREGSRSRGGSRNGQPPPPPPPKDSGKRGTLVISVSQRVEVQTVESPSRGMEEGLVGGDYLAATNKAECYGDCLPGEGSVSASGRREGSRGRIV